MFKAYRQIHDAMEADPEIQQIRKAIHLYQEQLEELEQPYREKLEAASTKITSIVLEEERTIELHGVHATYYSPRHSVSWKSVAQTLHPSQELIDEFTRVGDPRVRIKVKKKT